MLDPSLLRLYKELPLEQCRELYKTQHDNIKFRDRKSILVIMGAKYVYGTAYTPTFYKTNQGDA